MPGERGVQVDLDRERDLATFRVEGPTTMPELARAVAEYQQSEVTKRVLWDLTRADLSALTPGDVRALADAARKGDPARSTGRTAFVFADRASYGLGRMFEILQDLKDSPVARRSFTDMDEAKQWLGLA